MAIIRRGTTFVGREGGVKRRVPAQSTFSSLIFSFFFKLNFFKNKYELDIFFFERPCLPARFQTSPLHTKQKKFIGEVFDLEKNSVLR